VSVDLPTIAPATLEAPDQDAITLNKLTEARMLARDLAEIQVTDDETNERASAGIVAARGIWKDLEARREAVKKPALEFGRKVDAFYKAAQDPLATAAKQLEQRCLAWRNRVRAESDRRQREAAEAAAKARASAEALKSADPTATEDPFADVSAEVAAQQAEEVAAAPAIAPPKTVRAAGGGSLSWREVPAFEIVDRALIPDEFWVVNEAAIAAVVKQAGKSAPDTVQIPGVRVFLREESQARR